MRTKEKGVISISCMGAIRPLKNHLIQANAAIIFAEKHNLHLNFHINGGRVEAKSDNILKNLENLFNYTSHNLIKCKWLEHDDFLMYLHDNIDIGMQVSFSETYNIVAADHIVMNIPIITSPEINIVSPIYHSNPTDIDSMIRCLDLIWYTNFISLHCINKIWLRNFNKEVQDAWVHELHLSKKGN